MCCALFMLLLEHCLKQMDRVCDMAAIALLYLRTC
jgi:hypothetical protein